MRLSASNQGRNHLHIFLPAYGIKYKWSPSALHREYPAWSLCQGSGYMNVVKNALPQQPQIHCCWFAFNKVFAGMANAQVQLLFCIFGFAMLFSKAFTFVNSSWTSADSGKISSFSYFWSEGCKRPLTGARYTYFRLYMVVRILIEQELC